MTDTYLALISKHQKRTDVWNIVELFWTDFKRNKTIMSSSHFSCPSWAVISDWPFDRYTRYQLVIWFLYKNCNGTFWIFIASLLFHTRYGHIFVKFKISILSFLIENCIKYVNQERIMKYYCCWSLAKQFRSIRIR